MEVKNVFIIWDEDEYTKTDIINELVAEEYAFNFSFADSVNAKEFFLNAKEVWTFGDVSTNEFYKKCFAFGKEIWVMG